MAVLYVEAFFLQNAVVDAGLLWLAAAWHGGRIRPLRILFAALMGAAWSLLAIATGGLLRSLPAQALVSLCMVRGGVGTVPSADLLKSTGAMWIAATVLGGAVTMGLSMLLAGVGTGFAGMLLLRRKNAPLPPRVALTIRQGASVHTMDALVDTGNRALDPMTARPAILLPEGLFTPSAGNVLMIRTAAGARVLPCFTPDEIMVNGTPVWAVVALAPRGLLDCALVPWALCAERGAS